MNASLKLETAEKIVAVINELLTTDTPILFLRIIGDGWPMAKPGVFVKTYAVDYHDGTAAVGLAAAGWTMTGAEKWHVDANDRLLSCRTTTMDGESVLFTWRDLRDPNVSWNFWRTAEQDMPYTG